MHFLECRRWSALLVVLLVLLLWGATIEAQQRRERFDFVTPPVKPTIPRPGDLREKDHSYQPFIEQSLAPAKPVIPVKPHLDPLTYPVPVDLFELIKLLPKNELAVKIRRYPVSFSALLLQVQNSSEGDLLRLVDRQHAVSADFVPQNLENIDDLAVTKSGIMLRKTVKIAAAKLLTAAEKAGYQLQILSGYRSYDYQQQVYNYWHQVAANADNFSAAPGHSQHQLGTVIDIGELNVNFGASAAGRWLAAHAADYGFSLSYPLGDEKITGYSYEPWHFRYIGELACQLQADFFADSQQLLLQFWHAFSNSPLAAKLQSYSSTRG